MTAPPPFVTTLRARRETVRLGTPNGAAFTLRVELPEQWDVVRIVAPPNERVLAVKVAALAVLDPRADVREFVIKINGREVLDEQRSVSDVGARDGSIFLITHRRRRPVR
ncbi:MAG TPA: hypothetical protein VFU90_00995 [Candidatus Tumulicola sp.]|jgi:hypothetical protein|nr:hypothetical protein [Candidatus Tumulicola sp.]HSC30181.1 hypothetical protein [Gemmatimonadaceae bacterium]